MTIPKIIWQTWKTKTVPDKWKDSPVSVKKYLPDYEYHLYDDNDNLEFVKKHFPDFLPIYNGYKHNIQRADAIRPMRLYIDGGVYMDLDMKIVNDIEHLFKHRNLVFTYSANFPSITNMFMASSKNHPIWLEIIDEMKKGKPWWAITKHFEIMMTTGPGIVHRCVYRGKYPYTIIPPALVNAYDISVKKEDIEKNVKNALIIPLEGGSWHSWDTKLMGNCHNDPWGMAAWVILILIGVFILIWAICLCFCSRG